MSCCPPCYDKVTGDPREEDLLSVQRAVHPGREGMGAGVWGSWPHGTHRKQREVLCSRSSFDAVQDPCSGLFSVAVIKHSDQKQVQGGKGLFHLKPPGSSPSAEGSQDRNSVQEPEDGPDHFFPHGQGSTAGTMEFAA